MMEAMKWLLVVISFTNLFSLSLCHEDAKSATSFGGYRSVRLKPRSSYHGHRLDDFVRATRSHAYSVPMPASAKQPWMDIVTSQRNFLRLHRLILEQDIPFEILASDMEWRIPKLSMGQIQPPGSFPLHQYHRLDEINTWLWKISDEHKDLMEVIELGKSSEGRSIMAAKVTGRGREGKVKPAMWIDAGVHSNEWIAPAALIYTIHKLVTLYGKDDQITWSLDNLDWYLVPVVNVDGYEYTWSHDRMWRKSRSVVNGSRCRGVDLNRNWNIKWAESHAVASGDPCSQTYSGPHAESEPEIQAVVHFLRAIRDRLKVYLSVHSYSQLWLYPYSYTDARHADNAPDLIEVSECVVRAMRAVHGQTYRHGTVSEMFGKSVGSSIDYVHDVLGVNYTFGVELRDKGTSGHLLPSDQIIPTSEEFMAGVLELVRVVCKNSGCDGN